MRKTLRLIAYILLFFLVVGFLVFKPQKQAININQGYAWERYDPALFYKLQNTDDLVRHTDSIMGKNNRHSLDYIRALSRTISYRFYHGYSYYSFHQNWLSFLAGEVVWDHLNAIVIPNDILKYPQAACSQVSIVLAGALKKIGVPYRKVGLKGHFALEANLDGKWYFFDANMEPHFPKGRKSLEDLTRNNELYAGYEGRLSTKELKYVFSVIQYGKPNEALAPNATLFHNITFLLSIVIALSLVLFSLYDFTMIIYRGLNQNRVNKVKDSQRVNSLRQAAANGVEVHRG